MGIRISDLPDANLPYDGTEHIPINTDVNTFTPLTRKASLASLTSYLSGDFAKKNVINTFTQSQNILGSLSATENIFTNTGYISTLNVTQLNALSSSINVINITQTELSGFNATGNVTATGIISSSSVVYSSGGNSNNWNSVYSTSQGLSTNWAYKNINNNFTTSQSISGNLSATGNITQFGYLPYYMNPDLMSFTNTLCGRKSFVVNDTLFLGGCISTCEGELLLGSTQDRLCLPPYSVLSFNADITQVDSSYDTCTPFCQLNEINRWQVSGIMQSDACGCSVPVGCLIVDSGGCRICTCWGWSGAVGACIGACNTWCDNTSYIMISAAYLDSSSQPALKIKIPQATCNSVVFGTIEAVNIVNERI